jgi:hypothetical protein
MYSVFIWKNRTNWKQVYSQLAPWAHYSLTMTAWSLITALSAVRLETSVLQMNYMDLLSAARHLGMYTLSLWLHTSRFRVEMNIWQCCYSLLPKLRLPMWHVGKARDLEVMVGLYTDTSILTAGPERVKLLLSKQCMGLYSSHVN